MKIPAVVVACALVGAGIALAQEQPRPAKPDPAELIRAVKSSRNDPTLALKKVKQLVKDGADVNHVDRYGVTPLGYAADVGDLKMTRFLWSKGASHDIGKERPLIIAAGRGRLDVVKFYINTGVPANTLSAQGNTALQVAQRWNQAEVIQYLEKKEKGRPSSR